MNKNAKNVESLRERERERAILYRNRKRQEQRIT